MSNTSRVSPYSSETADPALAGLVVAGAVGLLAGVGALARWLAAAPVDEETRTQRATARREQRLQASAAALRAQGLVGPHGLLSAELHLSDLGGLLDSAGRLGYRTVPLELPEATAGAAPVLLQNAAGERLAIGRSDQDRLVVHAAETAAPVHALVRQHTVDCALRYFAEQGMQVAAAALDSGEVQILARESQAHGDGAAQVKTQVHVDGRAWIDVGDVRGRRCLDLVQGFASAVGGQVTHTQPKSADLQQVHEPTGARRHVNL